MKNNFNFKVEILTDGKYILINKYF